MQKVLLVENEPELLAAMEKATGAEDRKLLTAGDRNAAFRYIEEEDIDLVVTDLALHSQGADTDGLEVLKAAKKRDAEIPVIVVSNYLTARSTEAALDLGAFDLIDRGTAVYVPEVMLRLKSGQALRFRDAIRRAGSGVAEHRS